MKTVNYIVLLVLFITLQSCEKERQRIITGTIIDKTTGEPLGNSGYTLFISGSKTSSTLSDQHYIMSHSFSTDSLGNFEVMFECTSKESLVITYHNHNYYGNDKWLWSGTVNKDDMLIGTGTIMADSL